MDELREMIQEYDYISFDVFDTLILRNVLHPADVFRLVEEKYMTTHGKSIDFMRERMNAEKKARKCECFREVNIDEVYKAMSDTYEPNILNILRRMEEEAELSLCIPNREIVPYYKWCIENGKAVYITSDMYFPQSFIEKILKNNGFDGYRKIFASCEYRVTKWENGELFSKLCEECSVLPAQILHIGNDKRADFDMARKRGLQAFLIKPANRCISYINLKNVPQKERFRYSVMQKFVANNMPVGKSRAFEIGFEVYGPLLYAYLNWIKDKAKGMRADKIFFLSRDGYVLKKGFEILESEVPGSYFYASRRAFIVPVFQFCNEMTEMIFCYKSWSKEFTLEVILTRLGINAADHSALLEKYGFNIDSIFSVHDFSCNCRLMNLLEEMKPFVLEESKRQFKLLLSYMHQEKMEGSIGIVDIGAKCSIETALRKVLEEANLNVNLRGLYLNVFGELKENQDSYLSIAKNQSLEVAFRFCYMLLEVFLSAPHGTVLGYKLQDGNIAPVFDKYEYEDDKEDDNKLEDLRAGALDFLRKYNEQLGGKIDISVGMALAGFEEFGVFPQKEDASYWGDLRFWADVFSPLATNKHWKLYIKSPQRFIKDLGESLWPAGFLMRMFGARWVNKMFIKTYSVMKGS